MSRIVAVAGGTGKLGRAIVECLVSSGNFQVLVFAREASETKSRELGASVVAIDYGSTQSIVNTLEQNRIDTVISTLGPRAGEETEMRLIAAADKSTVTKRYIPSSFGIRSTPEVAAIFSPNQAKLNYMEALKSTSLEYTAVNNGVFMDYWVVPHIKSYLGGGITFAIDMANKAAAIPGSGNTPVVFSYSFDIGNLVAALLTLPTWERETYIVGDRITWNEFLAIAEEARGSKFKTSYDPLDSLKKQQVTELPSHQHMYTVMPRSTVQSICAAFGILGDQGHCNLQAETTLNERFPNIKTRKVKDLVTEAWQGK